MSGSSRAGRSTVRPRHFPGQLDHLFRNNGDGTFTDVSREAGIEVPGGRGLGLAIADLDDDGRLDLFVANDGTAELPVPEPRGTAFRGGRRHRGAAYDGTGQATASMGVVADDLNGDGRIDLFHTNFINQTQHPALEPRRRQFADGTLAANLAAPSRSKTGFGTVALDVDNDGHLDLFVANGHTDDQPWVNTPMAQTAAVVPGPRAGPLRSLRPRSGTLFRSAGGRPGSRRRRPGQRWPSRPGGRASRCAGALLRNATQGGHWLGLRLRGTRSGRSPVGAGVTCRAGGRRRCDG